MKPTLIGYIRVSTDEQGKSGNGLDAQTAAIVKFADDNGYHLLEIVQECASGKLDLALRPVLKAAVAKSLKLGAKIVVSKLDRLSRKASFIFNLMDSRVKFVVVQFGDNVDEFMTHVYAVLGEKERKMIGERTRDALKALKAKGVSLGNPREHDEIVDGQVKRGLATARALGGAANASKADDFAQLVRPSIERAVNNGMSLRAIAAEFNSNGIKTARGGQWTATTISNTMARWA